MIYLLFLSVIIKRLMISIICPVTDKSINESVARLNAFMTLILLIIFILTPFKWIIVILVPDFLLRRIYNAKFSYLTRLSIAAAAVTGLKKVMINAGPKLFAANIGF